MLDRLLDPSGSSFALESSHTLAQWRQGKTRIDRFPMSSSRFPTGPWVGFYTEAGQSERHSMDLNLEFRDGLVVGEGADPTGLFQIAGIYHEDEAECHWEKIYPDGRIRTYRGFREEKGIWGTWHLPSTQGGFHIWPIGGQDEPAENEDDFHAPEEVEVEILEEIVII